MSRKLRYQRSTSILVGLAVLAATLLASVVQSAPPAEAASITECTFRLPENPHLSSFALRNGILEIKSSTGGECQPSPDPVTVTAQLTLEKAGFLGFFSDVAVGPPIAKRIQGLGANWQRNELVVVAPCVPGTYRARLEVSAQADGGIAFVLGRPGYSRSIEVDCKPKRVSMVIDDTGSMAPVIASVRTSLATFINSRPEDEYTSWSLTTFKDSPSFVGTTEDRAVALGWVNALDADGGGDCPEDALGGISNGLAALGTDPETDKQMVVATDASAQSGDVDGIIASARAAGVRVNVLLTGDCGLEGGEGPSLAAVVEQQGGTAASAGTDVSPAVLSSQEVLRRIAEETGGKYFFLPDGNVDSFTEALDEIFESIGGPPEPELSCAGVSGSRAELEAAGYTVIEGTDGNDRLFGTPGNDFILGGAGRDQIRGASGDDVICGGDGNDVLDGGSGADRIDGGDGADTILGGLDSDGLSGGPGPDTINGDTGDDLVDGGTGNDRLLGGTGNDEMLGGDGDDVIDAGTGADDVDAGAGNDRVVAGADNDVVTGGEGNDRLDGGPGNDTLNGAAGNDVINAGPGNDTLAGDEDDDDLRGGAGIDFCDGGPEVTADIVWTCETVVGIP